VLKVVHEKKHAWALVLRDILARFPGPYKNNSRVLLAIVREKLLDGKSLSLYCKYIPALNLGRSSLGFLLLLGP
jgi:hypothetical protein